MTDPVLRHQDSPHVAVSFEVDAEQVEYFALHPVGGLPHTLERLDGWIFARQLNFQHRAMPMRIREQVIDDLDAVLVIDAALIGQAVHRQVGVFLHETPTSTIAFGSRTTKGSGFLSESSSTRSPNLLLTRSSIC